MKVICSCLLLVISLVAHAYGQHASFHMARDSTGIKTSSTPVWKYHAGDLFEGALPNLNDNDWESLTTPLFFDGQMPESGWPGIGWFRLTFTVDSTLVHVPLFVNFEFNGAAEIYLNGELLAQYGQVGTSAEEERSISLGYGDLSYIPLMFSENESPYVLAIRHSNFIAAPFHHVGNMRAGFGIRIGYPHELVPFVTAEIRRGTAIQFAFTLFPAAFALLFGLLYAFQSNDKIYLYFALLALGVAGLTFTDLQLEYVTDSLDFWAIRRLLTFFNVFTLLLLLHMVYTLHGSYKRRYYYVFLGVALLLGSASILFPFRLFRVVLLTGVVVVIEIARIVVLAIYQRSAGAWIVGLGVLFFILGISYDMVLDLGWMNAWADMTNGYHIGFLGLLVAMAVYLGQRFSQINKNLVHQIERVQDLSEKNLQQERQAKKQALDKLQLEAENQRKQLELEKAKALEQSYNALEAAHQDLKKTQTQLIHAEKMASLGQLTAGIAHELKNPLNFVTNFAELNAELAEDLQSAVQSGNSFEDLLQDLKTNAGKIEEHSKRANAIVQNMMRHASNAQSRRMPMDVNKLVLEYLVLIQHGWQDQEDKFEVHIESSLGENVGDIEMAPQEIGRVLINLFDNAFDAMLEKRTASDKRAALEKKAANSAPYRPVLRVETRRLQDSVQIEISDNGAGIPDQVQKSVFEPFFTTKPTGTATGLGLSLSYEIIVNGHGGSLEMNSKAGEGTTFSIQLPIPA